MVWLSPPTRRLLSAHETTFADNTSSSKRLLPHREYATSLPALRWLEGKRLEAYGGHSREVRNHQSIQHYELRDCFVGVLTLNHSDRVQSEDTSIGFNNG